MGTGGLAVMTVGALLVTGGSLDASVLPLLTLLALASFIPVAEIARIGKELADTLASARRIFAVEDEPVPVTMDLESTLPCPITARGAACPVRG